MKKLLAMLMVLALCVSACAHAEEMWTCPNCGQESSENFCSNCGAARLKVGDTVTFGTYAGKPIEWQVLEVKPDGSYILLSVKGLDAKPYDTEYREVTWETCSLRTWLNGEFYESAFSDSEKEKMLLYEAENPDIPDPAVLGGNTTYDRVYLLSLRETERYFDIDACHEGESEALICLPTVAAIRNGAYTVSQELVDQNQQDCSYPLKTGACWWWLRSSGSTAYGAARVDCGGRVRLGSGTNYPHGCVRPVICVRL